jgi:hypothetical protein
MNSGCLNSYAYGRREYPIPRNVIARSSATKQSPCNLCFSMFNGFLALAPLDRLPMLDASALWLPETFLQHLGKKGNPAHLRINLILCLQETVPLILVKNEVDLLALGY